MDPVTMSALFGGAQTFIQAGGLQGVGSSLGIGASYNPANGGEIRRQLENGYNPPWPSAKRDAYIAWCQQYAPAIYNGTQSQWDGGYQLPNSSYWGDRYDQLGGAQMDGQGNPVPGSPATGNTNPMGQNIAANGGPKNLPPPTQGMSAWNKLKFWWQDPSRKWWEKGLAIAAGAGAVVLIIAGIVWLVKPKRRKTRRKTSRRY